MISGFSASDIGQYGIDDLSWWTNQRISLGWFDVPIPVGASFDVFNPWRDPPTRTSVPQIPVFTPAAPSGGLDVAIAGPPEVLLPSPAAVIDPEYRPTETVYEDEPMPEPDITRWETNWDAVYEQYVELNAPAAGYVLEEDPMAHDWGHVLRQGIGAVWPGGGDGMGGGMGFAAAPAALPPGVGGPGAGGPIAIDPRTGKPVCKRRRRRRLLTEGDFNDLMRIATLPNKDTVKVALAKAVGRR